MALRAPRSTRQPRPTPRKAAPPPPKEPARPKTAASAAPRQARGLSPGQRMLLQVLTLLLTFLGGAIQRPWKLPDAAPGGSDASGTPTPTLGEQPRPVFLEALASPVEQVVALPLPRHLLPGQKQAPCTPPHEVELHPSPGCWLRLDRQAPCRPDDVEREGRCYVAVYEGRRTPVGDGGR